MTTTNEETDRDVQIDEKGLEGLPEKERKETTDILEDIKGGEKPKTEPTEEKKPEAERGAKPDKPEEKKPEVKPEVKPEEKKPDDVKPESRRDASLVPAWMLKVQEDQAKKREDDLQNKIKELTDTGKTLDKDGSKSEVEKAKILEEKMKPIAERMGITVDELKDVVTTFAPGSPAIPTDLSERLKEIDKLKSEREIAVEEAKFSADFDKQILPLIKAEYGDDVPPETISKLKEELKTLAYTPDFAKVPYSTIYKGTDTFRGVIPSKKKSAESNRGGTTVVSTHDKGADGDIDWEDPELELSEEQLRKLSDTDFDKYSGILEKREKSQRSARIAKNEG